MKALLIIDMQKGCFIPYSSRYDTLGIIDRINQVAKKFRQKQYPVIFIQHDGTSEQELLPQTDDWQLLPEMETSPTDRYINKTANDSFYKTGLQQLLADLDTRELCISGTATDFCVDATVKAALSKDYKVTVLSDCHTTSDKPYLPASTVIEYYNWIWSSMSPTKYTISVIEAASVAL